MLPSAAQPSAARQLTWFGEGMTMGDCPKLEWELPGLTWFWPLGEEAARASLATECAEG